MPLCPDSRSGARRVLVAGWRMGEASWHADEPGASVRMSAVHGDDRLEHEPEAPEYAEQFPMAERLAGRGQPGSPGRLLEQGIGGVCLEQTGLLVVAVAVDDAVRASERTGGVDRIQR